MLLSDKRIAEYRKVFCREGDDKCELCGGNGWRSSSSNEGSRPLNCHRCNPNKLSAKNCLKEMLAHCNTQFRLICDQADEGKVAAGLAVRYRNVLQQVFDQLYNAKGSRDQKIEDILLIIQQGLEPM